MTLVQLFTAIANAIRAKKGTSETITAEDFPAEINSIPSGSSYLPDWSEIGYEDTPQVIIDGFNYAKDIKDNWDSSITDMRRKIQFGFAIKIFSYGKYFKCNKYGKCFRKC